MGSHIVVGFQLHALTCFGRCWQTLELLSTCFWLWDPTPLNETLC